MMRDIDEELRKIIEGYTGAENPPPDTSGDLPRGTKVSFAEPELETAAPAPRVIQPRAPIAEETLPEKVVQVPGSPAAPDDMELAAARLADRRARSSDAFDRGGRQLVAGLPRTPVQATMSAPSDVVAQLLARRKAADATHQGNEQIRLGAAKMAFDKAQAEAKTLEDKTRDTRDFSYKSEADKRAAELKSKEDAEVGRHNLATEANGRISALKPSASMSAPALDENGRIKPKNFREQVQADARGARPGWEPIDATKPLFRSSHDGEQFDKSEAAMGAIRNHKEHVIGLLEKLKGASDPADADVLIGEINAQMGALSSKLRDAEGLNNTDAANHVMENMLSMSGGSIVNVKNALNSKRLPAILDTAISSGETNLNTLAKSANLRRAKAGKGAPRLRERKVKDGVTYERADDGMWDPVEE